MSAATPRRGGGGGGLASPAPRPLGSSATPTLSDCPGNDDERERRQRRRSRAADLQLGSTEAALGLVSSVPGQVDVSLSVVPRWTNAQISDHYSTCIKLFTENKINTKNVFGLYLIDYMTDILKQKDSELTNFKIAAGTLDASAKIYAVRVDVVHADMYKVLGGLGKDSTPTEDMESPKGEEDNAASGTVKRVQTKKKHSFKTIEQNLNNINVTDHNRRCEVDPMFQKTSASFDECSTAGIFLTSLRTQSCHSKLLFDSEIVPLPSSATVTLPNYDPVTVTDLNLLLSQCIEKRPICSSLAGFQFTHWDAESHDESVSALLDKFKKSDQVFNINAEIDSYVEDGGPMLPDGDFNTDSPRSKVADEIGEFTENKSFRTVHESKRLDAVPFGEGDIRTMCLHLSMKPGEYSYFSPRTLSMWAGPDHWRFKPHHKSGAVSEQQNKKKNAKKVFEVNFDEDIDFETYFRKTKAALTLKKSIPESRNRKATTLPADFNYNPNNFVQLFLKPLVTLCRLPKPGSSLDHEDEIGEYDYNNPNDTSNFCPAVQAADSDDDNDPIQFMGQTEDFNLNAHSEGQDEEFSGVVGVDIAMYGELNLIAEPQKVNKIAIQYAKTAKKMDMKMLKQNMWDILLDTGKKHTLAEIEDMEKERDPSVVTGEKAFSDITKELLHRLPSTMVKNLSVPLAFTCLLHLANEKNLKLEGTEDLSDVTVKQGD
ncbi:condensin complex subunit 2 isoform X2 [Cygnus olor]|uniref:condensin complex subunit 2 isoform X2 n=1 Tax=Cygnus olor TaxID=8869 RepID=UPI001ADE1722|nr:condensin complex subunit 2 isoform X2 [Cygnus olor]